MNFIHLIKICSITIFIFFCACGRINEDQDFVTTAPATPQTIWLPQKKEQKIASHECIPLFPKVSKDATFTLAELIDIALKNNPLTKESWADARAAAASYQQSLSDFYPEITAEGQVLRLRQTYFNEFNPSGTKNIAYYRTITTPELKLAYTIFDFGQRRASSDMARYSLYYADWMHNQQIQDIIQMVLSDYYDVQYQKEALEAFEANLDNAKTSLDAAITRYEAGISPVGDVAQAKTRYLQTQIDLVLQKKALSNSYAILIADLGLPANIELEIEYLPITIDTKDTMKNLDELIMQAKNKRQDLKAAQANYKVQQANLSYAKRERLPIFNTEFDIGKNFYNDEEHEKYHFSLLFKLSFPLFRGFYYTQNIRNAQAKLKKSHALLQQAQIEVIKDVTISQNDIQSANQTLSFSEQYLQTAELRFNIAMSNYKAGTSTILDLMTAQADLADARSKWAKSRKEWFSSLAQLTYATGSLCSPFDNGEIQ